MTTFNLEIKCDNSAFGDGMLQHEIARILRKLADKIEGEPLELSGGLRDINGNRVGSFHINY